MTLRSLLARLHGPRPEHDETTTRRHGETPWKSVRRAVMSSFRRGVAVVACTALSAPAGAEIIDRILAVVNGSIVTLSDVRGAMRLGLVVLPKDQGTERNALERLIERRLILMEVDRYAPPEPPAARIDALVAATRRRFNSDAEFDAALAEAGLTLDELRRHHRDDLRADAYLQQRFGATLQPSDDDLVAYYRAHEATFTRGGVLRPFDEVRAEVRAAMIAERRDVLIRDWVAGLRRRADISVLLL